MMPLYGLYQITYMYVTTGMNIVIFYDNIQLVYVHMYVASLTSTTRSE